MLEKLKALFNNRLQSAFILALLIFIGNNTIKLFHQTVNIYKIKKIIPYQFEGIKFSGLQEILKDEEYVSYVTDKDLKEANALKQFSQAQYVLTPVILDSENLNHRYLLFDCSTEEIAQEKIKELNVQPLRRNQFGVILAKKSW